MAVSVSSSATTAPIQTQRQEFSTTNTTYTTVLQITGQGRLKAAPIKNAGSYNTYVRITIDGNIIIADAHYSGTSYTWYFPSALSTQAVGSAVALTSSNSGITNELNFHFAQSLQIEIYTTNASNAGYVFVEYEVY